MTNSAEGQTCPDCGAVLTESRCWLCNRVVPPSLPPQTGQAMPPLFDERPFQYSLETLFLMVTVVAVCAGAISAEPFTGTLLAVIAVIAWFRTVRYRNVRRKSGVEISVWEKVWHFILSQLLLVILFLASLVAFCIACTTALLAGSDLACLVVGGIAAIVAFAGLARLTWPRAKPATTLQELLRKQ